VLEGEIVDIQHRRSHNNTLGCPNWNTGVMGEVVLLHFVEDKCTN
jgi:hypothetical protein